MTLINIASEASTSTLQNISSVDVQPNAIDLRLKNVFQMWGSFILSEDDKQHRNKREIVPDLDGWYHLEQGSYEIGFDNTIIVGKDEAGFVITRSTLNRNGVYITTGLYDSGYHGPMAACLHVRGGNFSIQKGTRMGQYLSWKAEALHAYSGSYGVGGTGDDQHLV